MSIKLQYPVIFTDEKLKKYFIFGFMTHETDKRRFEATIRVFNRRNISRFSLYDLIIFLIFISD